MTTSGKTQQPLQGLGNDLVVDNRLRVVKDKLPAIAVDEAHEGHQGHGDFGRKRRELRQRYVAIPVDFAQLHHAQDAL